MMLLSTTETEYSNCLLQKEKNAIPVYRTRGVKNDVNSARYQ